jgi:Na+-transporting NADH:ubiquinone oxidoreductase subunit C
VDKNSTNYVLLFVLMMTVVVALVLTGVRQGTESKALENEAIFNKRAVLAAVNNYLGMGEGVTANDLADEKVLEIFDSRVKQITLNTAGEVVEGVLAEKIDMAKEKKKDMADRVLPLFQYENDGETFYILSVRGSGLWDEIWGNIALESDINTIAGASFDHKGETPGLGAEIKDNPTFPGNFSGKKIFRDGEFVSVVVRKGGAQDPTYEVDGISGATVTADGVTKMLHDGISLYLPYLNQARQNSKMESLLIDQH